MGEEGVEGLVVGGFDGGLAAQGILGETLEEGEIIVCPDCGVELEVISVDPLVLEMAPEEAEDWGE